MRSRRKRSATALLASGLLSLGCSASPLRSPAPSASLPVTRVVLYQSGVGYFERAGTLYEQELQLQVRPSQINDLLKSLTLVDSGRGRPVSASLPLEQSADRALGELPEPVRNAGGVLDLLRLLRGAHVKISGGYQTKVEGRIVGVERFERRAGASVVEDHRITLKADDGEVIVYPVSDLQSMDLEDEALSVGLDRSLAVSLGEGGWKPIRVTVRLAGESPHRIHASYIVEMPRWKPAYRLVLRDDRPALLQGWAVVDNVSGEDWYDVQLSLVSGNPLSFQYNLHTPQYTKRLDLTPAGMPRASAPPPGERPGYAPIEPVLEEADEEDMAESEEAPSGFAGAPTASRALRSKKARPRREARGPSRPPPPRAPSIAELQASGEQAEGERAGVLFRYDIADPVTIPDRSSTLVNIVNKRISGEQVAYFRPELGPTGGELHPYRAVRFQNDTGLTLEKGPITVLSGGTFVGEGFVERMPEGATSFLTFAIDERLSLDQHGGARDEKYRLVRISGGLLVVEAQRVRSTRYEVKSRADLPVRAYIRSARVPGWEPEPVPAGSVETADAIIVPLDVPPGRAAEIEVAFRQPVQRSLRVDTEEARQLLQAQLEGGHLPAQAAAALRSVFELTERIAAAKQEERRVGAEHAALGRDQDRVRANLNVLRKTQGNAALQRELADKLAAQEKRLGQLSGERVRLSERIAALQAELGEAMAGVSLE